MSPSYIPGVEVLRRFQGQDVPTWLPDEDGALLRSERIAARAFEVEAVPFNEGMLADLEWQSQMQELEYSRHAVEHEAAREDSARMLYEALGASGAVGLVSVLSTQTEALSRGRGAKPVRSFRVTAERAAAVQAAGAFIAGGDEARMAKLRRAVGFSARAHAALRKGHRPDECRMVTLTYRDAAGWRANQISKFMDCVRKWHDRRGLKCRYVWVAEIQDGKRRKDGGARDAVHYHVALWVPKGTPHLPKPDDAGWWPYGSTRIEVAKGAVQYLMHYLKKGNSKNFKEFPDGCRIYSVGGLDFSLRRARRWLGLPGFVQGNASIFDDWTRVVGGGWACPSGELYPSEFRMLVVGGVRCLQRVRTHERSFEAHGPFCWLTDRASALESALPN